MLSARIAVDGIASPARDTQDLQALMTYNAGLIAVLAACVGAIVYFLFRLFRRTKAREQDLLLLCHGSKEQKERLIALEQRKDPSRSRSKAVEAALYALRRDKR
jgi:hypothetical protein